MNMVTLLYGKRKTRHGVRPGTTIEELLGKRGINKETVLVFRNKEPVPDTYKLKNGDEIETMLITTRG